MADPIRSITESLTRGMTITQLRAAAEEAREDVEKHTAILRAIETEIAQREGGASSSAKKHENGSKRGPGRPRKHPAPDPSAPKRPVGRPRKDRTDPYPVESMEG